MYPILLGNVKYYARYDFMQNKSNVPDKIVMVFAGKDSPVGRVTAAQING